MIINWKKMAKEKIEPICIKKGFKFYKPDSGPGLISYIKFPGPDPDPSWVDNLGSEECSAPLHEVIHIYTARMSPEITVDLMSNIKRGFVRLKELSGLEEQWWRLLNQDDLEKAFNEIEDLIEKYAWDWFALTSNDDSK